MLSHYLKAFLRRLRRRPVTSSVQIGGLAVLLTCLGLFGLAAGEVRGRIKEIGVRKVLGAMVAQVAALVSGRFVRLVGFAVLVGTPVAYLMVRAWLRGFAYRISPEPGLFLSAAALAGCSALLAVGYHAVRGALRDPVESLRSE